MIHLITYATENMSKAAAKCSASALKYGVNETHRFRPDSYPEWNSFNTFNKDILSQERGGGYWIWKPYFILLTMHDLKDGDILIYSDAGVEFINSVHHIIDRMDEDIFFFGNNWNHVDWCKADVYRNINATGYEDCTGPYTIFKQVQASVIFFKVNDNTRRFVKEWLLYCQMPDFIDDSPSKIPNYPTFQEHRHDQAILTCLQIKYGYKLHYWPAQYNNGAFVYEKLPEYANDDYPIIFHHHRKRNDEWNG
jgi:hypothetical protein